IDRRLKELDVQLPAKALVPRANALQWRRTGNLVFVSGQGPAWDGEIVMTGRLGDSMSVEKGQEAARLAALNVLFHLRQACDGDLDRVKCCVMVQAYVRCTDAF